MKKDIAQRKRQACRATFEGILGEEQLLQAVKMLETEHLGNDMTNLIGYINRVGEKFGIDATARKTLYPKYYSYLNTPGIELPEDPLADLQQQPPRNSAAQLQPSIPTSNAFISAPASPITTTEQTIEDESPEMRVFAYFIERLLIHFPLDQSDLLDEAALLAGKEKSFSELDKEEIIDWLKDPAQYQWNFTLAETTMSTVIHLFYVILCDVLGPVEADRLYHQVLYDSKQLPAAKLFAPTRFL